jgi:hypothetical protein
MPHFSVLEGNDGMLLHPLKSQGLLISSPTLSRFETLDLRSNNFPIPAMSAKPHPLAA